VGQSIQHHYRKTFTQLTNNIPSQEKVKNAAIALQEALIEATQNTEAGTNRH
jgi:hypothetical protein